MSRQELKFPLRTEEGIPLVPGYGTRATAKILHEMLRDAEEIRLKEGFSANYAVVMVSAALNSAFVLAPVAAIYDLVLLPVVDIMTAGAVGVDKMGKGLAGARQKLKKLTTAKG